MSKDNGSPVSRAYPERYRSQGFTPFDAGEVDVPAIGPGWYATAYRFVLVATGQTTATFSAGVVWVE